nr:hypothetical protein [Tanacetum cinerariifolium]
MESCKLEIVVQSAKALADVKIFGTMDPYVVVWISGGGKQWQERKTHVAKKGGSCPVWNSSMDFHVSSMDNSYTLFCEILHDGKLFDRNIGQVQVPFRDLLSGKASGKNVSYPVKVSSGEVSGEIILSYKLVKAQATGYPATAGVATGGARTGVATGGARTGAATGVATTGGATGGAKAGAAGAATAGVGVAGVALADVGVGSFAAEGVAAVAADVGMGTVADVGVAGAEVGLADAGTIATEEGLNIFGSVYRGECLYEDVAEDEYEAEDVAEDEDEYEEEDEY